MFEDQPTQQQIIKVIWPLIEGSSDDKTTLISKCLQFLEKEVSAFFTHANPLSFEPVIDQNCNRKSYGIKPKNASQKNDSTPTAYWCWELVRIDIMRPYGQEIIVAKEYDRPVQQSCYFRIQCQLTES